MYGLKSNPRLFVLCSLVGMISWQICLPSLWLQLLFAIFFPSLDPLISWIQLEGSVEHNKPNILSQPFVFVPQLLHMIDKQAAVPPITRSP